MARVEGGRPTVMVQEKDGGGMDQGTISRNGHKWSDLGFILKVELPTGFV